MHRILKKVSNRFRSWFKKWLSADDPPPQPDTSLLPVLVDGKPKEMFVSGTVGLHLVAFDGRQTQLIGEGQTPDRLRFWQLWRKYNPHDIRFENGDQFIPPL